MGRNSFFWISLVMLCVTADMRADSTAGSLAARPPVASEVSDVENSKRFGYIPSRGRKSQEEQIKNEESGGMETGSGLFLDEEAKRAFHGARGKKLAMLPMYPYNFDSQWKRRFLLPSRNVYTANGMLDQVPMQLVGEATPVQFQFGRGRKPALGEENESAEEFLPDAGISQQLSSNQPFYSRLLGSNGRTNAWMGMPSKDDEAVGKRMVYYTSRG